jgi:hypothetical protein
VRQDRRHDPRNTRRHGHAAGLVNTYAPEVKVVFHTDSPDPPRFEDLPCVRRVSRLGRRVEVEGTDPVLALVAASLVERGITPRDLRVEQPILEDVFLKLTAGE